MIGRNPPPPPPTAEPAVTRPVWRSFRPEYLAHAVQHVKAGGFAAIFHRDGAMKLLLPRKRNGELTEMALWALLSIEVRRWGSARRGPARGPAAVRVQRQHL